MNWKRIPKEKSTQPEKGAYHDWKELLAEEGFYQCVYCAISEGSMGGIRNFHVEHYKPKGLPAFAHLENVFTNLFYACPICNSFKGDDWPEDPTEELNNFSYPDPSRIDYSEIFIKNIGTPFIDGKNTASKYMIEKLYLNRPQLLLQRREIIINKKYDEVIPRIKSQVNELGKMCEKGDNIAIQFLIKLIMTKDALEEIFHKKDETRPYKTEQVRRVSE